MHSITAACYQTLARAIHPYTSENLTTPEIATCTGINPQTIRNLRSRYIYDFFQNAVHTSGNPDIGLMAYKTAHPQACNPFSPCLLSAPNLGIALERMVKFHALISTGTHIFLEHESGQTLRIIGLEFGSATAPRAFLDAGAALLLGILHFLCPDHKPMPLKTTFTYPRPACIAQLTACFGANLSFSTPVNSMTFCQKTLELPIPTACPELDGYLLDHAKLKAEALLGRSTAAKLRRVIQETIALGRIPEMAGMARALNLSPRSLQNLLEREETHFKQILDQCRHELARHHLVMTDSSIKHIAAALGFTGQSSFNKACTRWFDMPPGSYRTMNRIG